MTLSISQMRDKLMTCTKYGRSVSWTNKVKSMSSMQVLAVYTRLLNSDRIK